MFWMLRREIRLMMSWAAQESGRVRTTGKGELWLQKYQIGNTAGFGLRRPQGQFAVSQGEGVRRVEIRPCAHGAQPALVQ